MNETPAEILSYNASLDAESKAICDVLLAAIEKALPDAERKIWHAHPVWFFEGNPVVGYHRLKADVRIMFWSGQSFTTAGLKPEGTFKAAEARYTAVEQIDVTALHRWLGEARDRQWNYRDIRKNSGLVPLRGV